MKFYHHIPIAVNYCFYVLFIGVRGEGACKNGFISESLIVSTPRVKEIVDHRNTRCPEDSKVKHFEGMSLGYVTPWNNRGYDVAKWAGHKFTHISPVWLQILYGPELKFKILGSHDIDVGWIQEVKKNNIKMLPRILLEGWTKQQSKELESTEAKEQACKLVTDLIMKYNFDGIVLEAWMQLLISGNINIALDFTKAISEKVTKMGKEFILVVPPVRGSQTIFGSKHFDILSESVTAFSLMTYDYSSGSNRGPGPVSPVGWMKEAVEHLVPKANDPRRAKILLGLNFYGYHFTPVNYDAILGPKFIELTKQLKQRMKLDKDAEENYLELKTKSSKHIIYYPTLFSINRRIQLAKELGTGIAVWELGQGLDYFVELL